MTRSPSNVSGGNGFAATRWTRVLAAQGDSPGAREALGELCAAYYEPVLHFLQRQGFPQDTARELVHEFFADLLNGAGIEGADPCRGRFRSYLLGALKHFLNRRKLSSRRLKRGGGVIHESLDPLEGTLGAAWPEDWSRQFDREWALKLLERVFLQWEKDLVAPEAILEFEVLKPWLIGSPSGNTQAEVARQLGVTEGAVRVRIHRMRRGFRERVKSEIRQTIQRAEEVDDELRYLIQVLA